MQKMIALLLSFVFLISPLSVLAEETDPQTPLTTEKALGSLLEALADACFGETPGLSITVTSPEGETTAAGFGQTATGFSVHYTAADLALMLTESSAYMTDTDGTISTGLQDLLNALSSASGGTTMPMLTAEDFQLLSTIGEKLAVGVLASDSLTWSFNKNLAMVNLHIDLDALLRKVNELLPQILTDLGDEASALFSRLSPWIFGQNMTVGQFLETWKQLNLGAAATGLTLDAALFTTANGFNLVASCMGWSLKLDVDRSRLAFVLTSPDGKTYPLDTNDLLTVISILSGLPGSITEEAFCITQETQTNTREHGSSDVITTTTITTDLALVVRDLRNGLVSALQTNALTVNTLLQKYAAWLGGTASASTLIDNLNRMETPESVKGEVVIISDSLYDTVKIDGHLEEVTFEADLWFRSRYRYTLDAALRGPNQYGGVPFEVKLNASSYFHSGNTDTSITLSYTDDRGVLRGFHHSSTYNIVTRTITTLFNTLDSTVQLSLETDPRIQTYFSRYGLAGVLDYIHRLNFKCGCFTLDLVHDRYNYLLLHTTAGDGRFLELIYDNTAQDGGILSLTTNDFGLSLLALEEGSMVQLEGYIKGDAAASFTATANHDAKTYSLDLYGDGLDARFTYIPGKLTLLSAGQELVIEDAHSGTPTLNTTRILLNGTQVNTLVFDMAAGVIRVYKGTDTTGTCWEIVMDFDAKGATPPADAQPITAQEFLTRLEVLFPQPSMDEELPEVPQVLPNTP